MAFQFQPSQISSPCFTTVSQVKRADSVTGAGMHRAKVEGPSVQAPIQQSTDSLAPDSAWKQQKPVAAGQFKAVLPAEPTRKKGIVARFRQQSLRVAPAYALARHLQKTTRRSPAEHEISGGDIFVIIALIVLGFSLVFVGIPLLIAAEFSLGFWTALACWLGLLVAFLFLLFIREIIDTIGDLFRPRT